LSREKLRILLAEGELGRAAKALHELSLEEQSQLELTSVSMMSTLLATLEIAKPELIFLDLAIASPSSLGAVRLVHRAAPQVPLILIADSTNRTAATECLTQGAFDWLDVEQLDADAIGRVLCVAMQQNTLEGLANLLRDPVTGLYTRDGFLTLGMRAMENAKRKDSTLVLLCLRIENLATIRAEFGPGAEESSLRKIGGLLAGSFRRTDVVARLGESQFAALAIDAVEPSAPVLCQRLERRIAALNSDIGPWGPLALRMNAQFWSPGYAGPFSELLDTVEAGLRAGPRTSKGKWTGRETLSRK